MSDFEVLADGTVKFPTGYAGIPDHVWFEMLAAYPQLQILREQPVMGKTPLSHNRVTWTIHPAEPLTEKGRTHWAPGPVTSKPMHIYLVPGAQHLSQFVDVEGAKLFAEVGHSQSVDEVIARRTNEIKLEVVDWIIFVQTSSDSNYEEYAEVWQCQVQPTEPGQPGQLTTWRAETRRRAAQAFGRPQP